MTVFNRDINIFQFFRLRPDHGRGFSRWLPRHCLNIVEKPRMPPGRPSPRPWPAQRAMSVLDWGIDIFQLFA
jgi:hypothetical protein